MVFYHNHHIIPKHAGGTDNSDNLVKLTVEEHAEAHKKLWEEHGRWQDRVAWLALSKQITSMEATILASKLYMTGRKHSEESKKKMSEKRKNKKTTLGKRWKISDDKRKNMGAKGPRPHFKQSGGLNNNSKSINTPYGHFTSIKECADYMSIMNGLKPSQNRYIIDKNIKNSVKGWKKC